MQLNSTIAIRWERWLKKPVVMLFSLSDRLTCNSSDRSHHFLPVSPLFFSPQQSFHQISAPLLLLTLLIYVSTVPCELTAPYPTFALRFNWAPWISSIWPILHQGLDLPPCLFGVYFWLLWWFDNISKKYERLLYVCFQTTALSLAYKRLILIFFSSLRRFSPYMIPPE